MDETRLNNLLEQSQKEMQLALSSETKEKLLEFLKLLTQWNKVHNLTAIRDPKEMVIKHLLDSLSVLPFLKQGTEICDVGTGAGLPGIPLSLCKPESSFCLLDSNQKKINFVQHAILSLNLNNAKAICARAESFKPSHPFDEIISRAFGSLAEFVRTTAHLGNNQTTWLAMKAKLLQEELAALPEDYTIEQIHSMTVPHLAGDRCLVVIKKKG